MEHKYTTMDITCVLSDASTWSTQLFAQPVEMAQENAEAAIAERVARGRDRNDPWNKPVIMAFTFCNATRERRTFKMTGRKGYTEIKHVESVVVL